MKSASTAPAPGPALLAAADPLQACKDALRARFPSREDILREARAQTERQALRRRRAKSAATLGATAALLAGLWVLDPAWRRQEIATAVGQRATWTLADGSRIDLNTDTRLVVESRLRTRRFRLEAGEAAFTVAPGWRPFLVGAGAVMVRDIGTAFTVRRSGEQVAVGVMEGTVEVTQGAQARVLHAPQRLDLEGAAGMGPTREGGALDAAAWRQGRLVFDGATLAEVAAEVSRHRRAPFTVADAATARLRLSGSYELARLESLIDSLPLTLPVQIERAADGTARVRSRLP